jgi:hypothetical protein
MVDKDVGLLYCTLQMDDDRKKRVEAATQKWSEKQLPKPPRKKSNDKPEARFALELKKYLTNLGWDMTIIEAKANFSESSNRYTHGAVAAGYPDLSGNMPNGIAVYIETKAPGNRSTIRPAQHAFLLRKISTNCFAICCDSLKYFDRVFTEWNESNNPKAFLIKELPNLAPRYQSDDSWFDNET